MFAFRSVCRYRTYETSAFCIDDRQQASGSGTPETPHPVLVVAALPNLDAWIVKHLFEFLAPDTVTGKMTAIAIIPVELDRHCKYSVLYLHVNTEPDASSA
jgi:hypothetical protein